MKTKELALEVLAAAGVSAIITATVVVILAGIFLVVSL